MAARKRLGELLIDYGLISDEQLQDALQQQGPGQRLGETLLAQGVIDERKLRKALSVHLRLSTVELSHRQIHASVLQEIPARLAVHARAIPVAKKRTPEGEVLYVAMDDPTNLEALEAIRQHTQKGVEAMIALVGELDQALALYYPDGGVPASITGTPLAPLPNRAPPAAAPPQAAAAPLEPTGPPGFDVDIEDVAPQAPPGFDDDPFGDSFSAPASADDPFGDTPQEPLSPWTAPDRFTSSIPPAPRQPVAVVGEAEIELDDIPSAVVGTLVAEPLPVVEPLPPQPVIEVEPLPQVEVEAPPPEPSMEINFEPLNAPLGNTSEPAANEWEPHSAPALELVDIEEEPEVLDLVEHAVDDLFTQSSARDIELQAGDALELDTPANAAPGGLELDGQPGVAELDLQSGDALDLDNPTEANPGVLDVDGQFSVPEVDLQPAGDALELDARTEGNPGVLDVDGQFSVPEVDLQPAGDALELDAQTEANPGVLDVEGQASVPEVELQGGAPVELQAAETEDEAEATIANPPAPPPEPAPPPAHPDLNVPFEIPEIPDPEPTIRNAPAPGPASSEFSLPPMPPMPSPSMPSPSMPNAPLEINLFQSDGRLPEPAPSPPELEEPEAPPAELAVEAAPASDFELPPIPPPVEANELMEIDDLDFEQIDDLDFEQIEEPEPEPEPEREPEPPAPPSANPFETIASYTEEPSPDVSELPAPPDTLPPLEDLLSGESTKFDGGTPPSLDELLSEPVAVVDAEELMAALSLPSEPPSTETAVSPSNSTEPQANESPASASPRKDLPVSDFCPSCGATKVAGAKFCGLCGTKMDVPSRGPLTIDEMAELEGLLQATWVTTDAAAADAVENLCPSLYDARGVLQNVAAPVTLAEATWVDEPWFLIGQEPPTSKHFMPAMVNLEHERVAAADDPWLIIQEAEAVKSGSLTRDVLQAHLDGEDGGYTPAAGAAAAPYQSAAPQGPSATMIAALPPDQLRALAERLVQKGAVTQADLDAASKK